MMMWCQCAEEKVIKCYGDIILSCVYIGSPELLGKSKKKNCYKEEEGY